MEAVVSRMKTIQVSVKNMSKEDHIMMRFVAISATIPNVEDVSEEMFLLIMKLICIY